jgi:hypothetical protein
LKRESADVHHVVMPICSLCNADKPTWDGVCIDCANNAGLPAPAPPLRPRTPCERCHGRAFVRCVALRERGAFGSAGEGQPATEYLWPLAATFALHRQAGLAAPDMLGPLGMFEAYICRACGYTELYARDAAAIPIGREYGTEHFETEDRPPYR